MIFNMTGGGGSQLNFKVVAYATEELLTADTPKENTIGIVTTTPIPTWYFAAEQPENMAEGDVWFYTGTDSSAKFNALKKNSISVYPQYAKQYVNGALVDLTAKIYQGNTWVNLASEYVIFDAGRGALVTLNKYKESASTITVGTETINVGYSATDMNYVTALRTDVPINMAKYSKLSMEFTATKRISSKFASFGVTSTAFTKADPSTLTWVAKTAIATSTEKQTITVDLSSVNESLYVAFQFGGAMAVTKIWLE